MNVNDPNCSYGGSSAATSRARETLPSIPAEDIHLSELLRSLRSLVSDSPERQAKIEGLMLAYASGDLQIDAEATASAIIDDAILHPVLR